MSQQQYFIGLNGPPGAGKDTFAEGLFAEPWIQDKFLPYHVKFSTPLKNATHALFGGTYSEAIKNQRSLFGPVWRDIYIAMSERFAKREFGEEIFGTIMVTRMKSEIASSHKPTLWICSDCGFAPEQNPVIRHLGADQCKYIHILREGYDFNGDSRSYIEPKGVQTLEFWNNRQSVPEARMDFNFNVMQLINDWGWANGSI